MHDSKGISMISLIVTIVCIIVLSSLAIGTGTKYIRESRARDRETFITVMSSAVARRHEDTNLNSISYPYLGYYIKDGVIFDSVFAPKVAEEIKFEDATWYVVDTTTARELGVMEPEKYIETVDENYMEEITVALVDYESARVYLINAYASEISDLENFGGGPVLGHNHRYVDYELYPTCTEPRKCADCGFIDAEALGHTYDPLAAPELAVGDEENAHYNKVCTVCGMQGGYERHTFEYVHFIKDELWYHKASCTVCGYTKRNVDGTDREELCTQVINLPESEADKLINHIRSCRVCLHEVTEPHDVAYRRISESMHEKYCAHPLCGFLIAREYHVDNDGDERCDLCGSEIVSYAYPQISIVEMEKTNPVPVSNDDRYIARYGDTIKLKFVADKQIKNLEIYIGAHLLDASNATISTSDNKTWEVIYVLDTARSMDDGNIKFSIYCESLSEVPLPSKITSTTNGKIVLFDGTNPVVNYITKPERVDETM